MQAVKSWQPDKSELLATESYWAEKAQAGDRHAIEQLYYRHCDKT